MVRPYICEYTLLQTARGSDSKAQRLKTAPLTSPNCLFATATFARIFQLSSEDSQSTYATSTAHPVGSLASRGSCSSWRMRSAEVKAGVY